MSTPTTFFKVVSLKKGLEIWDVKQRIPKAVKKFYYFAKPDARLSLAPAPVSNRTKTKAGTRDKFLVCYFGKQIAETVRVS